MLDLTMAFQAKRTIETTESIWFSLHNIYKETTQITFHIKANAKATHTPVTDIWKAAP